MDNISDIPEAQPPPNKRRRTTDNSEMGALFSSEETDSVVDYEGYPQIYVYNKDSVNNTMEETKEEGATFDLVRAFVKQYNKVNEIKINLWIVGGFVTAKLCNISTNNTREIDVDLAVSGITGEEFGKQFNEWMKRNHNIDIKFKAIEQNDSKSKHLATGTFHFNNIAFDVVGLRGNEQYANDSRVPSVKTDKAVTLEDDALRRDFTVNAIYCNLMDRKIVDLVSGIEDLQNGYLRTCNKDAFKTFFDDPLRLIRAIRHGITKFGFKIDKSIVDCFYNKTLIDRLATIIARERLASEFLKILKGKNTFAAMKFIVDFGIASVLFDVESDKFKSSFNLINMNNDDTKDCGGMNEEMAVERFEEGLAYCQALHEIMNKKTNRAEISREISGIFWLSSFLYPWRNMGYQCESNTKKKRIPKGEESLIYYFCLDSLPGLSRNLASQIVTNCQLCKSLLEIIDKLILNKNDFESIRLDCGVLLCQAKHNWTNIFLLVESMLLAQTLNEKIITLQTISQWIVNDSNLLHSKHKNNKDCWNWNPLISTNDLSKRYNIPKNKLFGMIIKDLKHLQLAQPNINKDDLNQWVKKWKQENII